MSSSRSTATRVVATAGLVLGTLIQSLDVTIAHVALPHVQGSLSASQDQITWMLTSYIVGQAIMMPFSGWLSQKIGRKPLLLISIVAFTLVSLFCGAATSLPEMVLFRFLQGISGAALVPLSQACLLDMWPPRLVPQVIAIWSCAVMVAPIFGPTVGGFLTEHLSWRWVFYINLPLGALAFATILFSLEREKLTGGRPFDALGFGAIVVGSIAAQLMLDRGPILDWFDSPEICVEAVIAACALYVFVTHSLTARHPFFPRELFRNPNLVIGISFTVVCNGMLFSTMALLPTFMQTLLGYSAMQSGMAMAPRGLGSVVTFAMAPWLASRFGQRRTVMLGLAVATASLWQMSRFDLSMTTGPIFLTGFLQGASQGLIFNPIAVMMYATLAPSLRTDAAVLSNTMRTLGSSVGIALLQSSLTRSSAIAHERIGGGLIAADPVVRAGLPSGFENAPGALEMLNAEVTRQASMMSYDTVFAWMCFGAIVMLPLLLVIRPVSPRGETIKEIQTE